MSRADAAPPHGDSPPPHPATSLRFVRVEYADGPDRCTIHPRTEDRIALMSTWLTADEGAFVDLADRR